MSDALNLALTITATDLARGVLNRLRDRIVGTGDAAKQVRKDFDQMTASLSRGVKAAAVAGYIGHKLKPGVTAAADLQQSMLNVKQLLWTSSEGAGALAEKLARVRRTAVEVSANLPYSAKDLADIETNLLQGGVALNSVVGRHGAAFGVAALTATSKSKMAPADVAESMAKIGHAFQLTGKQYGGAADTLSRVSGASAADLPELLYNLRRVGPAAHALNVSLKDTAVALGAVSSLGDEAGSDMTQFFSGLAGAGRRGNKAMHALGISFFDAKGNFIGLTPAIIRLRKEMAKIPSQQERFIALQRMFGTQGAYAARLLIQTGQKSYDTIQKNSDAAASLADRTRIWAEGLNASMQKLGGTSQSLLADVFNPILSPITALVNKTNEWAGALDDVAAKHQTLAGVVSGAGVAAAGGAALYGAWHLLKAGGAGLRVLKGMKGLGSVAGGVVAGKALEAAAGVQPVYVVNMPSGGLAGDAASIAAATKGAPGLLRRLAPMAGRAGLVGAAGAGGYLLGQEIYKHSLAGNKVGDAIGSGIAHVLAFFGNKDAKAAIAANERAAKINGTIKVEVNTTTGKARVTHMHSDNAHMNMTADTGLAGATS